MQKQYSVSQPRQLFNIPVLSSAFNFTDVLIFKTNIQSDIDKLRIKKTLDRHPLIKNWNIDLEDVDRVLRVEAKHLDHQNIIALITGAGHYCEELMW